MATMFPTLGKTTVHIGIANGKWIEVDKLSSKDYARFIEIHEDIAAFPDDAPPELKRQKLKEAHEDLLEMAKKVMPEEMHDDLKCFNLPKLTGLVNTLCTGDDDSENDDPKKKITLPSQISRKEK